MNQKVFKNTYLPKASSKASCPKRASAAIKLTVGPIPELQQLLVTKNKTHLSVNHRTFQNMVRFLSDEVIWSK